MKKDLFELSFGIAGVGMVFACPLFNDAIGWFVFVAGAACICVSVCSMENKNK